MISFSYFAIVLISCPYQADWGMRLFPSAAVYWLLSLCFAFLLLPLYYRL